MSWLVCQGTGWQTVGADLRCVRWADPGGGEESCGAYRSAVRPRRSGIDHQALGEQQQREPKRHLRRTGCAFITYSSDTRVCTLGTVVILTVIVNCRLEDCSQIYSDPMHICLLLKPICVSTLARLWRLHRTLPPSRPAAHHPAPPRHPARARTQRQAHIQLDAATAPKGAKQQMAALFWVSGWVGRWVGVGVGGLVGGGGACGGCTSSGSSSSGSTVVSSFDTIWLTRPSRPMMGMSELNARTACICVSHQ